MVPSMRHNQNWLPEIFNDFFDRNWIERATNNTPAINIIENDNDFELHIAAPGMTKEDFNINLDNEGDLVIKMEKKAESEDKKNGHYIRREFSYSKFQQTMLLPENADRDKIEAKMANGILTINIPKLHKNEAENQNKVIEIR